MKVSYLCGRTLDGLLVDVIKMSAPIPERPGDYEVLGYKLSSGEELKPMDPSQQHFETVTSRRTIHLVHDEARAT